MRQIICDVCKSALNSRADGNLTGIDYIHPEGRGEDHEPKPVEAPEDWRGECDFCSDTNPAFILPTRGFKMPGLDVLPDDHMSAGDWAACDTCAKLIERDQWNRLVQRAVDAQIGRTPGMQFLRDDLTTRLGRMYRVIRKNTTGPLRPL